MFLDYDIALQIAPKTEYIRKAPDCMNIHTSLGKRENYAEALRICLSLKVCPSYLLKRLLTYSSECKIKPGLKHKLGRAVRTYVHIHTYLQH